MKKEYLIYQYQNNENLKKAKAPFRLRSQKVFYFLAVCTIFLFLIISLLIFTINVKSFEMPVRFNNIPFKITIEHTFSNETLQQVYSFIEEKINEVKGGT